MKRVKFTVQCLSTMLWSALTLQCGSGATSPATTDEKVEAPGDGETAQTQQSFSQLGVERVIPIRFIMIDDHAAPCASPYPTTASLMASIRETNNQFLPAGIQFSLASTGKYYSSLLSNPRYDNSVSWSSIWADANQIDPMFTSTLYQSEPPHDAHLWIGVLANALSKNEISVFIPCSEAGTGLGHAQYPYAGIHITATGNVFGNVASAGQGFKVSTLAHELGHFFNLPHPNVGPGAGALQDDPDPAFFYDWWYADGPGGTVRLFTSKADLLAFDPDGSKRKSKANACTMGNTANGDLNCTFNGVVYKTSTHPSVVYPMGLTYQAGQNYGINTMGYLDNADPVLGWAAWTGFGGNEVARIKETARSTVGNRHLLGRAGSPTNLDRNAFARKLDFDGDGKRDFGYWRPSDKSCHVIKSSNGAELVITLSQADPDLGDQPMPGDYDGDGKADCAVYRPGSPSTWIWAASGSANQINTYNLGYAGDIPIAGLSLPASSGAYGRFAVWTRSTSTFWWRTGASTVSSKQFGMYGDELALADYDGDGLTDLAEWKPEVTPGNSQSVFYISLSSANYGWYYTIPFGTSTDVPLGPTKRDQNSKLEFTIWRPSANAWFHLMNPADGGSSWTTEYWGGPGDVPIAGWDVDADGLSDAVVYRPSEQNYYMNKSAGGTFAIHIGEQGDVPFASNDRDGDGKPELCLYRPRTGNYFTLLSTTNYTVYNTYQVGKYTDVPF